MPHVVKIRTVDSVIAKLLKVTLGTVSADATDDLSFALAFLRGVPIEAPAEIPDPNATRLFQDYVVQELLKVLRHKTRIFFCLVLPNQSQSRRDLAAYHLEQFQQKRIAADMQG
ncbi:hypothetical protein CAOG_08716 [Capsaspora owczarzaki ATCC 30864]|uniref:Uncharacterized protein n=1 Tax=Capsaspora owczarzaki (strain ATCC 30864) TaxID=595528 RepID=A0A0D2UC96_CAPO3|nr:hypothetical protein CAOG_08716 [Capsaspora owczarzaki ATCC 30864]KJE92601.1 hypothetical protein CAOG_008716 [Capsaspora owczarzaki ATCC 30864]|eukprot:XP_011270336.1 hypothetical protein CAOG_08716 [Capsaspora owczarzaki ATCC 30864]